MSEEHVYFTLPNKVFSYECRGCGACCKGLGIGLDARGGQVESLQASNPALLGFLRERGETWTAFNPRGGCWFLEDDGWCRIEKTQGRSAKPAACRLFPFNRVFRLGRWMVVDYNSVICPLQACPPEVDESEVGLSGRVTHSALLDELTHVHDSAVVGIPLDSAKIGGNSEVEAFIQREEACAEVCFAQATTLLDPNTDPQKALRRMFLAQSQRAQALETYAQSWAQWLLEDTLRIPSREQLRLVALLTPSMRFNEVFGPRSWTARHIAPEELAVMWRVWVHFVACGEELAGRPLTMQQATSVWGGQVSLMAIAALWRSAPVMEPGPIEVATQGERAENALQLARAMHANADTRTSFADLCTRVWSHVLPAERVVLLRHVESWMDRLMFLPARAPASDRRERRKKRRR